MDNSEVNFSGAVQPTSPLENAANSLPKEERKTISSKKRSKLPLIIILIVILLAAAAFAVYFFFINPGTKLDSEDRQACESFSTIFEKTYSVNASLIESQECINKISDNVEKSNLYYNRASFLFIKYDIYRDQIIEDALIADELNPTANTAYFLWMVYENYGYLEQSSKYQQTYNERLLNDAE